MDLHARGTACLNVLTKSVGKLNGLTDVTEGLFGKRPERDHGRAHFRDQDVLLAGKGGIRSARFVFECAVKKYAVKFIEDGNDVQALSNIDGWAESLCGVSTVRNENLMIHYADSNRVRDYQEKSFR